MADEREVRRRSIDPDRLLPGEQLDTASVGDAGHWVAVYSELVATKRRLVATLLEIMVTQPKDVRDELQRADVVMLQLQIERFEHRLALWRQRLEALEGPSHRR